MQLIVSFVDIIPNVPWNYPLMFSVFKKLIIKSYFFKKEGNRKRKEWNRCSYYLYFIVFFSIPKGTVGRKSVTIILIRIFRHAHIKSSNENL